MKKTTATSTFINDKYIPLEKKYKLGIFVLLLILPILIFYFFFFQPGNKKIEKLKKQRTALTAEVEKIKARAADQPKFEKELKATAALFDKTSTLLPKEKELPKLLTNISALGRGAGLDFVTFKPKPTIAKDFYMEIPVSITVNGPYHNVGHFFDQVSKLNRIVSVASVKMSGPKKEGPEMLLKSDCELMTYQFTNVAVSQPKQGKKK